MRWNGNATRATAKASTERLVDALAPIIAAARAEGIADGERRATAAIVAWLRGIAHDNLGPPQSPFRAGADGAIECAAHAIERGDHLTPSA